MTDYWSHTHTTPSNVQNTAACPPHPTLTKLGSCYKLPMLNLHWPTGGNGVQTIQQEFMSYITANCSPEGTDPLLFWAVSLPTQYSVPMSLSNPQQSHTTYPTIYQMAVKTRSPQVLLGGPGGQGTRVEVSPDTSRAWATTEVNLRAYGQSPERGKVVRSLWSVSGARTNPRRSGIVQGVLVLSLGWTWLSPLVRVRDLLGSGGGPKGTDRVRPENKMD